VATRQNDKIVIRTFLFITFSGTPEGQKLSQITGLNMFDKKYLAIDRLSTFMKTDIRENPVLADLFTRAGCGDLFQTDKIMNYVNTKNESSFSSELLIKYMNLLDYKIEPKEIIPQEEIVNVPGQELAQETEKVGKYKVLDVLLTIILFLPFLIYVVYVVIKILSKRFASRMKIKA
jgi:hypothetical protein